MRTRTDQVCGECGSVVVSCDECEATFCPSEPDVRCSHGYEDDD